jgi:hypothetical protein
LRFRPRAHVHHPHGAPVGKGDEDPVVGPSVATSAEPRTSGNRNRAEDATPRKIHGIYSSQKCRVVALSTLRYLWLAACRELCRQSERARHNPIVGGTPDPTRIRTSFSGFPFHSPGSDPARTTTAAKFETFQLSVNC